MRARTSSTLTSIATAPSAKLPMMPPGSRSSGPRSEAVDALFY